MMTTMEKPKQKQKKRSKHKEGESSKIEEPLRIENINSIEESSDSIVGSVDKLTLETAVLTLSEEPLEEIGVESVDIIEETGRTTINSDVLIDKCEYNDNIVKATQDCMDLSQAVANIVQPLRLIESSSVVNQEQLASESKSKIENITHHDIVVAYESTLKADVDLLKKVEIKIPEFTMEEIKKIFGVNELEKARIYAIEFEKNELQQPSSTDPLYDALNDLLKARSLLIYNQKDVESLISETTNKLNNIWHIHPLVSRKGGRCADGCYMEEAHPYQIATLQKLFLIEVQKKLVTLREKVTETHSQYSHMEHFLKYKIEDLLWIASVNGCDAMRGALRILFWVLRTTGWGCDRSLRVQLRKWCCVMATRLLEADDSLTNLLFLLHHILRVSRGIKWSFHLIKVNVKCWTDIAKVLCILEAIVFAGNIEPQASDNAHRKQNITEGAGSKSGEYDVGTDAMDDNVWFLVDSDGEGGDFGPDNTATTLLTETDVLGLLRQVPFEELFKELLIVRNSGEEIIFCGGKLNGGPILKIIASFRMILNAINTGLITYKSYRQVSKEFCRIALHCTKYLSDLWEVARIHCEDHLLERVTIEYNNLFVVTWNIIDCSGAKDIISMFHSEMPCGFIKLETVKQIYDSIESNLKVSDNISCYYTLVCISNMAVDRQEEEFVMNVIKQLFHIGFTSDFCEFGCGEWARTLCGTALKSKPYLIGAFLSEVGAPRHTQWLEALPLVEWRPPTGEIIYLLNHFKRIAPTVIPHILKGMNWSRDCLEHETHKAVALFLIGMNGNDQGKGQYAEWIWECILPLKLHMFDWNLDVNMIPDPETISELDLSGKCHASNILSILMTQWGHSVPLIFQNAAPVLLKLANAGRFGEVIHALYYLIPVLSDCPESISECKVFKEILSTIVRNEKTYTKMASRIVAGETVGPITKQLVAMIQSQLKHYSFFNCSSPRDILMVWVHWFTSSDGWNSDWVVIHLLDVALGSCFMHHLSISSAANHLANCIQNITAKSPTSSSSGFSWLWNSNTYKGLVQCSVEAPYVWHATLWTEHSIMERGTGLWQKVVTKLSMHKEGTKVNIDKILKSVGCSDTSSVLVIYRCIQYASTMSVSHPIFTLIWQLFFYLYFDISFLQIQEKKAFGYLFFEGMVNSRLLSKARLKLLEAKTYHENKVLEFSEAQKSTHRGINEVLWYHENQKNLMATFLTWLREDVKQYLEDSPQSLLFYDKFLMLLSGNNTLWMDTVDHKQLNDFKPAVWPLPVIQMINQCSHSVRHSEAFLQSPASPNTKSQSSDPSSRILNRLTSYEKPLITSCEYGNLRLDPLVDPLIAHDFQAVVTMMKYHLTEVEKIASVFGEVCKSLNAMDNNVYDMVQNQYEQRSVYKSISLRCGEMCKGSVNVVIDVVDWKKNSEISKAIDYNRSMYGIAIENTMLPYQQMAQHTSTINKLISLACNEKLVNYQDNGPKMFEILISYLKDDILTFPTSYHTIINLATTLGEKFITQSGDHFINLVCKIRGPEGVTLVGALLKPYQFSTSDMIKVYSAISSTVTDYHIAFSYLTKFDISRWLYTARPTIPERTKFLNLLFAGLGTAGCEPSDDRLILHELMCVHLVKVLTWEYPFHLNQVLLAMCNLSLEKKIPPDTWQHCITTIETYPSLLNNKQACEFLELIGLQWWSKRGAWGPNGLYGQYGIYCTQMGRLGALLSSIALSTAMLHNPPLLTKDICSLVLKAMQTYWNVWICPWWGGGSHASVWVGELCRGPALMPWGPHDDTHPDTMLHAFVETILYCATTLPGSLNDLLSLIWHWYSVNFPHPAVSPYVLTRIHKTLAQLPWTANMTHWLTWQDLRYLYKMTSLNIDSCNKFAIKCLGDRKWSQWIILQPEHSYAMAVQILLPIILRLNISTEVLEDAESLPWCLLSHDAYSENVNWFMRTLLNSDESLSSNKHLSLLCAAGGLTERAQYGEPWRNKREVILRSLLNVLCHNETPSCVDSVKFLLNKIDATVNSLDDSSDSQKYSEASSIITCTIPMFNMMKNTIMIEKVWCDWFKTTTKPCISAVIANMLQLSKRNVFANLAEEAIVIYFEHGGDWSFIISNWRNECVVAVDLLLNCKSLLTAMATYKASESERNASTRSTIHPIDKAAMQALYAIDIESSFDKKVSLWVCYIMNKVGDNALDRANTFAVVNQSLTILDKWAQEPSWGLLKAIGLMQNNTPSHRFRLLVRFALCLILDYQIKIKESTPHLINFDGNSRSKVASSIEAMANNKTCSDIKHIALKCLDILKQDNTIKDSLKYTIEICCDLYTDTNFIKNIDNLFDKEV